VFDFLTLYLHVTHTTGMPQLKLRLCIIAFPLQQMVVRTRLEITLYVRCLSVTLVDWRWPLSGRNL